MTTFEHDLFIQYFSLNNYEYPLYSYLIKVIKLSYLCQASQSIIIFLKIELTPRFLPYLMPEYLHYDLDFHF